MFKVKDCIDSCSHMKVCSQYVEWSKKPNGYSNLVRIIKAVFKKKCSIYLQETCLEAKEISGYTVINGTNRSTMSELRSSTIDIEKVIPF